MIQALSILKTDWSAASLFYDYQEMQNMSGILSVTERNEIVEEYLWCINSVIYQNYTMIRAAHLDVDDVYQNLAMRLIRAVELYDPTKENAKSLKGYIFMSLGFELRTCGGSQARYGFRQAPYYLPDAVISIDALEKTNPFWESLIAA